MQRSKGTFLYTRSSKTTKGRWNGSIRKQKKTYKVRFDLHRNKDRTVVDVDASVNPDKTLRVRGTMKVNRKTYPIHLLHYKPHYDQPVHFFPPHSIA
jgi:hypothetical protein